MKRQSRYTTILRAFRPYLVMRIASLVFLGGACIGLALYFAAAWLMFALVPFTAVGLIVVRCHRLTAVELHEDVAVVRKGVFVAQSTTFRRRRVDVYIRRPPLFGDLWDVGEVTLRSEQSSVTVAEIAHVRCLEQWLQQP